MGSTGPLPQRWEDDERVAAAQRDDPWAGTQVQDKLQSELGLCVPRAQEFLGQLTPTCLLQFRTGPIATASTAVLPRLPWAEGHTLLSDPIAFSPTRAMACLNGAGENVCSKRGLTAPETRGDSGQRSPDLRSRGSSCQERSGPRATVRLAALALA